MLTIAAWRNCPPATQGNLLLLLSRAELEALLAGLDDPTRVPVVSAPLCGDDDDRSRVIGDIAVYAVEQTDDATLLQVHARLAALGKPVLVTNEDAPHDVRPRCDECGARGTESDAVPGTYYPPYHLGTCSKARP